MRIIKYPSGRYGFVGSVPKDLAIRHRDNRTLTDVEFTEYSQASNPDMVKRSKNYVEPVFNALEEAEAFALDAGYARNRLAQSMALYPIVVATNSK